MLQRSTIGNAERLMLSKRLWWHSVSEGFLIWSEYCFMVLLNGILFHDYVHYRVH